MKIVTDISIYMAIIQIANTANAVPAPFWNGGSEGKSYNMFHTAICCSVWEVIT